MHWNSVSEFVAMGGYAVYVWGSVGACALCMLVEPFVLNRHRKRLLQRLREEHQARESVDTET
jgi:heme exporter protein D